MVYEKLSSRCTGTLRNGSCFGAACTSFVVAMQLGRYAASVFSDADCLARHLACSFDLHFVQDEQRTGTAV